MSLSEKEYQTVQRALARDRAQLSPRSIAPATHTVPQITKKGNEKTSEELLPLMMNLATLIDKLDSPDGKVRFKADGWAGGAKYHVMKVLRGLISNLQTDVGKAINQMSKESRKATKSQLNAFDDDSGFSIKSKNIDEKEMMNYL